MQISYDLYMRCPGSCLRGFIKVKYVKLLHLNGKDAETIFLAIFTLFKSKGKNLLLNYLSLNI